MKNWKNTLLSPEDTVSSAIETLNFSGMRIVLVVDKDNNLLGTITDGDIRRALIKRVEMDSPIKHIMNKSPSTASISNGREFIISEMIKRNLLSMPILDSKKVVGLETLQYFFEKKRHNNPVFIMAGGLGTRLRPLTEKKPKPLLNVGNNPILETIITQFIDSGFHIFYISVHYKAEMIRDYFGDGSDWGVTIKYIHENTPLGTAGSLGLLPKNIFKLPIIMMNGDLLTKVNFENLLNFYHDNNCLATMCVREYDFQVPYGVVDVNERHITKIIEKPVQKFFVNAGIYVISPELINCIDGALYLDMTDFLQTHIDKGSKVSVFPIHEYWLDIGRMEEYEKANLEVSGIFS